MKKSPAPLITLIGILLLAACATPAPAAPTPRPPSFASVHITKPTLTATVTATNLPTETPLVDVSPTIESTPTAESVVIAQIVEETTVIDYPAPASQPMEISAPGYGGNKSILVDISEQHMYVYEGDALVYSFVSSTGMNNATRVGSFSVLDKIPNAYGATWDIWMPNWLGIYWAGSLENGIHALPILSNGATLWSGYLGIPISYGCVVLGSYESQLLYDWADVGTSVNIQW